MYWNVEIQRIRGLQKHTMPTFYSGNKAEVHQGCITWWYFNTKTPDICAWTEETPSLCNRVLKPGRKQADIHTHFMQWLLSCAEVSQGLNFSLCSSSFLAQLFLSLFMWEWNTSNVFQERLSDNMLRYSPHDGRLFTPSLSAAVQNSIWFPVWSCNML